MAYKAVLMTRTIGPQALAVGTIIHIGAGMEAPADIDQSGTNRPGQVENGMDLTDYDHIELYIKYTPSFSGGATNPTVQYRLQRKIAHDLADTDDNAWDDCAANAALTTTLERVIRLGHAHLLAYNATATTNAVTGPVRDAMTAGNAVWGHPGAKLRIRETISGGDRTGGTAAVEFRINGYAIGG
jgi:hypothetical protein